MEFPLARCEACLRQASEKLPFLCTTCARNALYEPRFQRAKLLLEKEAIARNVQQVLSAGVEEVEIERKTRSRPDDDLSSLAARVAVDRAKNESTRSTEQRETIQNHIEVLREEMKIMKTDIAARKAQIAHRRSMLEEAKQDLASQQGSAIEPLQKLIKKTESRWNALHARTAEARVFLCREVANLYGLQQRKRRRGESGRDRYLLGGTPIVDLRDINGTKAPCKPEVFDTNMKQTQIQSRSPHPSPTLLIFFT